MQSNRFFAPFALASLLSIPSFAFAEESPLPAETLETMERMIPLSVSIRGRFRYASIGGTGDWTDAFLCETDMGSSGGEFCFFFAERKSPRVAERSRRTGLRLLLFARRMVSTGGCRGKHESGGRGHASVA